MKSAISTKETAFDMWSSLELNFSNTNQARVMELKLELQTFHKDSLSVSN